MRSPGPEPLSGITLYSQVAGVLRRRIAQGEWGPGQDLPTLEALASEYGVARVTVRQAIALLVAEGLLSSQRGRRTTVIERDEAARQPLLQSLAGPLEHVRNYAIRLIAKDEHATLPATLSGDGRIDGAYVRIRKIDFESSEPYVLSDVYVFRMLYRRFRRGAETTAKLARLVRDTADPPLVSAIERITVSSADFDEARALECPLAAPVARVQRVFVDGARRVVYAGWSVYRGDRFFVERELIEAVRKG